MTPWHEQRSLHGGVDQIPLPGSRGQLWLSGKHFVGPDPELALRVIGGSTVVCLTEQRELADRYPQYVEWLSERAGEAALLFPIPDFGAPDLDQAIALIDLLLHRLEIGHGLLIHCAGGIGRSGTIAVALLMAMGAERTEAMATVAAHRPMAGPEAGEQREFLIALERRLSGL